jgi:isoleucyl-tRNA synthetase
MRKEAGFEVTDRIVINCVAEGNVGRVVSERKASICGAVLANDLVIGGAGAYEKEWDINGEKAVLSVTKA